MLAMAALAARNRPSGVDRKMPSGAPSNMARYCSSASRNRASLSRSSRSARIRPVMSSCARINSPAPPASRVTRIVNHRSRSGELQGYSNSKLSRAPPRTASIPSSACPASRSPDAAARAQTSRYRAPRPQVASAGAPFSRAKRLHARLVAEITPCASTIAIWAVSESRAAWLKLDCALRAESALLNVPRTWLSGSVAITALKHNTDHAGIGRGK